ncbi:HlyD family secretion protein [Alcaligenes sp. PF14]|uniref:HlyD family secretion protein n=1 Tax=Alcaligenes sp. PF14 TaxID=3120297 RepID=UPI0030196295
MSQDTSSETQDRNSELAAPTDSDNDGKLGPNTEPSLPPKIIKPSKRSVIAMAFVLLGGLLLILWAWNLGPFNTTRVTTDNAYVRGQMTVLAPQVSGYVSEVLVQDFERVQAGQPLVRIDERIYKEKLHQAQAQLDAALAELANLDQAQAQNRASLDARKAALVSAQAEARRSEADRNRARELANKGSISVRERDQAVATAELGRGNMLQAKANIAIAEETIKSTEVARATLQAKVKSAEAALGLARIDMDNTVVTAPAAGQISEASVRQGQYVTAGSQLLFLVPDTRWVVANFKETQTAGIHVGQLARFTVDGLDGTEFQGHVERIAPATGSEFSVLRADNASGNFTKVVQRLPVRIAIDADQPGMERLRPGMSVIAKVDISDKPDQTKQEHEQ